MGLSVPELPTNNLPMFGKASNNTQDFISILRSRKLADSIIKSLHLEKNNEIYDRDNPSFQNTVEEFQKKVKIFAPTNKDSTIKVKARFKDKSIAIKICNKYFYQLNRYLKENNYLSTTRNRKFVEEQLTRITGELRVVEVDLLNFKKTNKTVSLPDEITEYIKYISDLEGQELKSKIELKDLAEKIKVTTQKISDFNPEWQNALRELEINQAGLKTRQKVLEDAKTKYFKLLNSLPSKGLVMARLERELKVKNTLYLLFTQQLESAKIEEAKELDPFKVLDSAFVSNNPVFPRKRITTAVGFVMSLIISILFAFFIEYWQKASKLSNVLDSEDITIKDEQE